MIAIVDVLGAPRKKQGSPLSKFPSFVSWVTATHDSFSLKEGIYHFGRRMPIPLLLSPTTTGLSLTAVSPPSTPPDRNATVWSLSNGQHSGACAVGETTLFGNGYSVAENPVEDRKNGYGGGIWCGHDASEIRGETQLLLPTLPDTHNSVASVPTHSLLPPPSLSQSHAIPFPILLSSTIQLILFHRLFSSIFALPSQPKSISLISFSIP